MPQQLSKAIGLMLFDEEVTAWRVLEVNLSGKNWIESPLANSPTLVSKQMLRKLLRLAAEHLSTEIGPEIAESLRSLPDNSQFLMKRAAGQCNTKPAAAKASGRKPDKKLKPVPAAKSAQRVFWDRPWKHGTGEVG